MRLNLPMEIDSIQLTCLGLLFLRLKTSETHSVLPPHFARLKSILVGAFYIDDLTPQKYNAIADHLVKITSRYHVLALGGLRAEADADTIPFLLTELNAAATRDTGPGLKGFWQAEVSQPLGGGKGEDVLQEKVVLLYRADLDMKIVTSYEFKDTEFFELEDSDRGPDVFPYNPVVFTLSCPHLMSLKIFTIVFVHLTHPDLGVQFDSLIDVYDEVFEREDSSEGNIVIFGPLNVGCGGVSEEEMAAFREALSEVDWLVNDDEDTLVAEEDHCSMDRILVSGEGLRDALDLGGPRVYEYDKASVSQAHAAPISERYPVEFRILLHEEITEHKDEL